MDFRQPPSIFSVVLSAAKNTQATDWELCFVCLHRGHGSKHGPGRNGDGPRREVPDPPPVIGTPSPSPSRPPLPLAVAGPWPPGHVSRQAAVRQEGQEDDEDDEDDAEIRDDSRRQQRRGKGEITEF